MNLRLAKPALSSLPALCLALPLALIVAGCEPESDDVYTPDERTGQVGRVARGDTSFPLEVGSEVPDVDGRATRLTADMIGIELTLSDLYVYGSCDPGDSGEFYFDIGVERRSIARRSEGESKGVNEGDTLPVNASRVFYTRPNESFSVYADVWEDDDTFTFGDDAVGSDRAVFEPTRFTLGARPEWQYARVGRGSCEVMVTYGIRRVQ